MGKFSTAADRISEFIASIGLTENAFRLRVGWSQGLLGKAVKNRSALGSDKLENVLRAYPELDPDWLLLGEGQMLRTPPAWVKKGGAAGQDEAPYLMQMAAEPAAPYGGKRSKGRRAPDATRVEELLANILVRLERLEQSRRLGPGALASTNSGGATTKSS